MTTAATQYILVSYKSICNWSKISSSKINISLLFSSGFTKHAYDILSKKSIEDLIAITTTPPLHCTSSFRLSFDHYLPHIYIVIELKT